LDRDLGDRDDLGYAERAALRAQARAVDVAESLADPELVSQANRVYLELRTAAGLTAAGAPATDTFAELLAELNRPSGGVRHSSEP
jgi:hypothetical protein